MVGSGGASAATAYFRQLKLGDSACSSLIVIRCCVFAGSRRLTRSSIAVAIDVSIASTAFASATACSAGSPASCELLLDDGDVLVAQLHRVCVGLQVVVAVGQAEAGLIDVGDRVGGVLEVGLRAEAEQRRDAEGMQVGDEDRKVVGVEDLLDGGKVGTRSASDPRPRSSAHPCTRRRNPPLSFDRPSPPGVSRIRRRTAKLRSCSSVKRPYARRSAGTGFFATQPPQANW